MLSDLKYIIGAVARKDYVDQLCHLLIKDGRATAYDGLLSMSTPIDIDLHVKPHARSIMKAVSACDDDTAIGLHVTAAGRLSLRCGRFKAFVDCLANEADMTQPQPEGNHILITPTLLDSMKTLAPFMSQDASRPWAQGLRICGNSTFATNNIILAEYWHGSNFPHEIIIPADAVNEIIRIDENPAMAQVTETSASFFFSKDRWLRTQLVVGEWPIEQIEGILNREAATEKIADGFFEALQKLKPFVDDQSNVYLSPTQLSSSNVDQQGAAIELDYPVAQGVFHLQQLLLLEKVAQKIDFSQWPKPCYFQGKKLRGVIIGKSA